VDALTNKRSQGRSNVFLAATLDTGAASYPVRIRNLSPNGALIEAPSLPAVGSKVRLSRGSLTVDGVLAWQAARVGGLNFEGIIDVDRWVHRVGHPGQQRVDGMVAALRRSEPVPPELGRAEGENSVQTVSVALDHLCERLAGTPNMSLELGENLIELDAIAQSLRQLATGRKA
jgi:hypothetical protein